MSKTLLKAADVNDEVFYEILDRYKYCVRRVEHIEDYYYGYKDKSQIYYNGVDTLICQEYRIQKYSIINDYDGWKQIILRLRFGQPESLKTSVTGSRAKAYMYKLLYKYYTKEEIDQRLHMFEADYDPDLKQIHYNGDMLPSNKIMKYTNTYKFDINGAHLDALCEIFPKATKDFLDMEDKKHTYPQYKDYANFFVGMLAYKTEKMRKEGKCGKYEKTYNWIVQRTSCILLKAMQELGGTQLYSNTDAVVVKDPAKLICPAPNLGAFKLEHNGNTYFYRDVNYILYQFGEDLTKKDVMKGSCLTAVRKDIDLSKGEVVHYRTICANKTRFARNIKKEILKVYEE